MSEVGRGQRPGWLDTLALALTTAAFAVAAALVMFSAFMYYDDEGYVLLSLKNFVEHGGLYRDVYTQYGPFPFVVYSGLHALGFPFTHTAGRLLTLGAWAGTAVAGALLTGYATRQLTLRLLVLAAGFVFLWVMANEPSHPGGLIVLLTAVLGAAGYRWIERGQLTAWALAVGAATAALLLTKINIGVFAAFSACAWWLLHHQSESVRRWALPLTAVWGVALPYALMRPLLTSEWVQTFALVFALSAVAVMAATAAGATGRAGWRSLFTGLSAAVAVAVVVFGVVLLRGTSPGDLLEGMFLGPLRHPVSFSLHFVWPPGIRFIATLSLAGCIAAGLLRRRHATTVDGAIAALRLTLALALAVGVARYPFVRPDYFAFGYVLPCIWLFAWPLSGGAPSTASARAWLALLLLGQCLHVFPVPGSQIAWGSVMVLPLAAIGAWDGAAWLARRAQPGWLASRGCALAVRLLVLGLFAVTSWRFAQVAGRYREGEDLGLPGAESIRLPTHSSAMFRVMTLNAAVHADVLFSLPGMYSLNLWTDLPTPTRANVTHWFSLLDNARQQAIIDVLEAHPRACVIIDRGHVDFLAKRHLAPRGLLYDYIAREFEPAFKVDDIEFCVRRGRSIQPFLAGELFTRRTDADPGNRDDTLLRFTTLLPPGASVTQIEIDSPTGLVRLHASNTRAEIAPANGRGEPVESAQVRTWPLALAGANIVSVYFAGESLPSPAGAATVILRDADGSVVALGRMRK